MIVTTLRITAEYHVYIYTTPYTPYCTSPSVFPCDSVCNVSCRCFELSGKYQSQLGLAFPIYGKKEHVLNHQPDMDGSL